jgi:hypothetical protein
MPSQGFNFRNTSAYVTDGTDELAVYRVGSYAEVYPTTRGGFTFGWDRNHSLTRNRSASVDRRLAGMHFGYASGNEVWRLDLADLNGADTYTMRAALGDNNYARDVYALIKDNTTTLVTIDASQSGSERFTDITGVNHTPANWPGNNNADDLTFATTTFYLELGDDSAKAGSVAHLYFEWTAGGGGLAIPIAAYHYNHPMRA